MLSRRSTALILLAALLVAFTGCSGDDSQTLDAEEPVAAVEEDEIPATDNQAAPEPLRILVTNDDGVDAPGIDLLVEGLRSLPDVEITVVAPAENQSGSGGSISDGPLSASDAETASGFPATSVDGYPADSIVWALDDGGVAVRPHVVTSGINWGQNIGPSTEISGTVGAARAAVARGIPALAVSQGFTEDPDYPAAVHRVLAWIEEHRDDLLSGAAEGPPVLFENLNVPTCEIGEVRGLREAPVAGDALDRDFRAVDCESTVDEFSDDVDAFLNGYAVLSPLAA
jgi:5'-nucleotidase